MKLIGLEFRVGMEGFKDIEVCVVPLDIVFTFPHLYPYGPKANVTLHTSMGDANAQFALGQLCREPFRGSISTDEVAKKYEQLYAQIHRITP